MISSGDKFLIVMAILGGFVNTHLYSRDVRETIRREATGNKLTLLLETDGKRRTAVVILKDLV